MICWTFIFSWLIYEEELEGQEADSKELLELRYNDLKETNF